MTKAPWTVRVATWSARHRWLVAVLWSAATLGTLAASVAAGGICAGGEPEELGPAEAPAGAPASA